MQCLGNINITVWFFAFWCWTFVTQLFLHKLYCIYFRFLFFDYKYLITWRIKNKQTLIYYFKAYFSVCFYQNGKTEYNYVYVLSVIFCDIFPYCKIKSNILFRPLNIEKSSEQHTGYSKFFLQQVPFLSNWCKFSFSNGLAGRFISRYWVIAE